MSDHSKALANRTQQLMAESGLTWADAWRQAEAELGALQGPAGGNGCVVVAWAIGVPLTALGVFTFPGVSFGQISDLGALSFIFAGLYVGLPLLIFAAVKTLSGRRKGGPSRP